MREQRECEYAHVPSMRVTARFTTGRTVPDEVATVTSNGQPTFPAAGNRSESGPEAGVPDVHSTLLTCCIRLGGTRVSNLYGPSSVLRLTPDFMILDSINITNRKHGWW